MFGLTYNLTAEVKSMLVGQLVVIAGMAIMGVIFLLCWGVYTRNLSKPQQRHGGDFGYPQQPMIVMGQQPQLSQQDQGYTPRQMPLLDLKATKEQEFVEW